MERPAAHGLGHGRPLGDGALHIRGQADAAEIVAAQAAGDVRGVQCLGQGAADLGPRLIQGAAAAFAPDGRAIGKVEPKQARRRRQVFGLGQHLAQFAHQGAPGADFGRPLPGLPRSL